MRLDSSDYYVMVIANTATSGSADVLYQFATYSANSTGEYENLSSLLECVGDTHRTPLPVFYLFALCSHDLC